MNMIPGAIEQILRMLSIQYRKENNSLLLSIIVNCDYTIEENTGYDNWNGGINGHTIHFELPEELFEDVFIDKAVIESELASGINRYNKIEDEYIDSVILEIHESEEYGSNWRSRTGVLKYSLPNEVHENDKKRIWEEGGIKVFISHKVENKIDASNLKNELSKIFISGFVAHEDIEPTRKWQEEIENALNSMDVLIAMLTPEFHDSKWTDQEIGFALGRKTPIIPIRKGLDPYGFIGKIQGINDNKDLFREIFRTLISNPLLQEKAITCFIEALKRSESFATSDKISSIIKFIPNLTEKQKNLVIEAYNQNSQIYNCWSITGRSEKSNSILCLLNKDSKSTYGIQGTKIFQYPNEF